MKTDLEGKVYEMRELKKHYGINSTNAHAFMRSEAAYEKLKSQVNQVLKPEGTTLRLSWQEMSNLCHDLAFVVKDALNEAHFQHTRDFNYFHVRKFNDELLNDRVIPWAKYRPGTPGLCRRVDYNKETTFTFDYERFLETFARVQAEEGDRQEAFRQAFLIFRDSREPYLMSPEGESLSYPRFVETVLGYGREMTIEEITPDQKMIAETAEVMAGYGDLVEDFKEWQMTGSKNYGHAVVKFHKVAQEERKFLYGLSNEDDLYERAIRERTDKKLETERRIALNYILGNYGLVGERAAIITGAIDDLTQARDRRRERLQMSLGVTSAPDVIIQNMRTHFEKTQYTLNAVQKTRKWLEEILSH